MATETREQQIQRWESEGRLDPNCRMCREEFYAATNRMPADVFAPNHKASAGCKSGKYAHCTCDHCF